MTTKAADVGGTPVSPSANAHQSAPKVKICFFCKHCTAAAGLAYSEYTWQSGEVGCSKGHWRNYGDNPDLVEVGTQLLRAETCGDYTPAKGVPK